MALLTRLEDPVESIRKILRKIIHLDNPMRAEVLERFLLTCGLRGLEDVATEELKHMPVSIQYDLTKYPIFGDLYRKGLKEGEEKGQQEGREEATKDALRLALKKRFGRLPVTVTKRIARMSHSEARDAFLAAFDARNLKDLFPPTR